MRKVITVPASAFLILEESGKEFLEWGLEVGESGAEILILLESLLAVQYVDVSAGRCMHDGGGPDAYALCNKFSAMYIDEDIPQLPPVEPLI